MSAPMLRRAVALRCVNVSKKELLSALADGSLIAEGRPSIAGSRWKSTDDPRFPMLRLPAGPLLSRGKIAQEWWQAVGLEVELQEPGWVLARETENGMEFILQIEVSKSDVERLWPGKKKYFDRYEIKGEKTNFSEQQETKKNVPFADLGRYLHEIADGVKTKDELRSVVNSHFPDHSITERLWRQAWADLPPHKKRKQGTRPHMTRTHDEHT